MNKIQNQKLKRLLNVLNFFGENQTITDTLYNAAVWQPRLDTYSKDIIMHAQKQATTNTGSTVSKKTAKIQLAEMTFFVSANVKIYARSINDTTMYDKVNTPLSILQTSKDIDLLNAANIAYDIANTNITDIAAVTPLTAANLTQLQQNITTFTRFIPQAQQGRNQTKFHTQEITRLFAESDTLLQEVADSVEVLRFSNSTFHQQFVAANKIGNAITRNRALQINVSDKATQQPIFKAEILITDANGNKVAEKKTTAKGNVYIQDIKERDYIIKAKQAGYQNYETTISITDGTTFILNIEMEQ